MSKPPKNPSDPQSGHRQLHVKVKTAKGRKKSSTKWLARQLNDPYVQLAQKEGYRSRAAYKLLEIDDQFNFLKNAKLVVDLGAAPGGWLQVAAKKINNGKVVGIDLQPIEPVADAILIQHDFLSDDAPKLLAEATDNQQIDVVLSDMAPASCGHKQTDHLRIMYLCEVALDFAKKNLCVNGTFIAKVLAGGAEKELLNDMKKYFKNVKHIKPKASRKDSAEMYVVALNFKGDGGSDG